MAVLSLQKPPTHLYGFSYHPPRSPRLLGFPQLDVKLFPQPVDAFFDTQWARFPVVGLQGKIDHVTLRHPWPGAKRYDVCVGRIILSDFQGRLVEAFSLGGELTINEQHDLTHCRLTSPAPIFDLASPFSSAAMLVTVLEGLLARQHAEWGSDDRGFEHCLTNIDAHTLFVAGVVAVVERLRQTPPYLLDTDRYQGVVRDIGALIEDLQRHGRWPQSAPVLDDLL